MNFAALVNLVQRDYLEMPGLELTLPQATRLWNLPPDDCRAVIEAMVSSGFLKWTPSRTIIRSGRDLRFSA